MKKFYAILCLAIASLTQLHAQAPQGFNYQATVRNNTGDLIVNTNVYFKFNVMQGTQTSLPVFTEVHYVPTDDLGQVTLIIGQGTATTGTFLELDWSLGSYYLGIELNTGNGYLAMGTTQLLSVPYALYAENSGNSTPTTPNLEAVLAENNSANNQQIKDLQDPTDAQDAVTKHYADTQFYTQSEVDAMISNLQGQVDDLNSSNDSGTVTDIDGNTYDYITYGDQDWTVENAEMVTYRDGTPIPQVTDNAEWANLSTGAWAYYNNDPTKGKLYNWYAVAGIHDTDPNTPNKEFAPEGWHVPSDAEWTTLENYLIANGYNYDGTTTENKIAKAMSSNLQWATSTVDGSPGNNLISNNSSGFDAFPWGFRGESYGVWRNNGISAFFWSSTDFNLNSSFNRSLHTDIIDLFFDDYNDFTISYSSKQNGMSVRFIKDVDVDPNSTDDDNDGYTEIQGDCDDSNYQVYPGATEIEDGIDNDCDGEIDEGFNESGTVIDQDGNTYDYLPYGEQVWTVENAEMVTYRDGTPIPEVTDNTTWKYLTTGAWCYYDNDPTKPRLYNWYAVKGIYDNDPNTPNKEFAPEGWHVPSQAEWITLEEYLIANGFNYDGTTTGNKIGKAMASTTGWNDYTSGVSNGFPSNDQSLNNSSGFNAIPEGGREPFQGEFIYMGQIARAYFWSSTENGPSFAWSRQVSDMNINLYSSPNNSNQFGFSVRFVRD